MTPGAARFAQAALVGDSDPPEHTLVLAERTGRGDAGAPRRHPGYRRTRRGHGSRRPRSRPGGGLTVGITPGTDTNAANPWCDIVLPTGLGHARNVLTALAGDFIVAVGGGAGTLSELCFAWVHGRPIYVLQGSGGWSDRLAGGPLDHRASSVIVTCDGVEALEREVERFCAAKDLRIRGSDPEVGS